MTDEQVNERIANGKINRVKKKGTRSVTQILYSNIFTFFNVLSLMVGASLIYIGATIDSRAFLNLMFLIVVILNTLIGILQELRAKVVLERLSLLASGDVSVIRNEVQTILKQEQLVQDDVIFLKSGDQIPVDCVIIDGECQVNESLLTGESKPVAKGVNDEILAGSFISAGTVKAIATKVGMETYANKLRSDAVQYKRPRSELLRSLRIIIRGVGLVIVVLTIALVLAQRGGIVTDEQKTTAVTHTAGAVVGMIPGGMFLLTSLALAVGAMRLARKKTLVQELYCIEMLARVNVLCLDKTGTITDGTMRVVEVIPLSPDKQIHDLVSSMMYALGQENQTSSALIEYFGNNQVFKTVKTIPFSSATKMAGVVFIGGKEFYIGAPEVMLPKGSKLLGQVNKYAAQGLRVLCLMQSKEPIAFITIEDTIRKSATETIAWFKENGVALKVISGDNPTTVSTIAKRVGIEGAEKYISINNLSDNELKKTAKTHTVFGRATPEQKKVLVQEFRALGKTVGMTGDGVNDILALKEADCSIAMSGGSSAACNVSHLVLLDNDFASLPAVVAEGRRVINNVGKLSSLFMFKTMLSVFLAIVAVFFMRGYYLFEPRNLYMLEILVIGLPSLLLAMEIDSRPIKGDFIQTVLRNAATYALVAIASLGVLYFLSDMEGLGIGPDEFLTLCILFVTALGLSMLIGIVRPFNQYRSILLGVIIVFIAISLIFFRGIIGLTSLMIEHWLILVVTVFVSSFCASYFLRKNQLSTSKS